MPAWIYFIHSPRPNFGATMTDEEKAVWSRHVEHLTELLAHGVLVLAGPTLGEVNTGIVVFEASDAVTAQEIMEQDPAIASGVATGELRPFQIALLRGRE